MSTRNRKAFFTVCNQPSRYRSVEATLNIRALPLNELDRLRFVLGYAVGNDTATVLQVLVAEEHLDNGVEVQQLEQQHF